MPFKKIAGGMYLSPSGRRMTKEQVEAYYATRGKPAAKRRRVTKSRKQKSRKTRKA